jgi:hypothetical protein
MKSARLIFIFCLLPFLSCDVSKELSKEENCAGKITIESSSIVEGDAVRITGRVIDLQSSEAIIGATVTLKKEGVLVGSTTDLDGKFEIKNIEAGTYELVIRAIGFNEYIKVIEIKNSTAYSFEIGLESVQAVLLKPVIYVYPTEKTEISVKLNYQGKLTHTYPKYPENGWNVTAEPTGTLWDEKGMEYYALFWEGIPSKPLEPTEGFIVPGHETAEFLEEKLAYLGLNRREANEFIMFWLPQMENNPYNLIHFAGQEYEDQVPLEITPSPETTIRVMMLTQPLQTKIDFPAQDLTPLKKTRKGFTVVEWGGSAVDVVEM